MKDSKIQWTDHSLNFWWGCLKVSPGCERCYAETFSKRVGRNIWGPAQTTDRWRTKGPWYDIRKWDVAATKAGIRQKVFVMSMGDFFEDHPQLPPWRQEACQILEDLQSLDIQLLTKRPENVLQMVPDHWVKNWPPHIWIGTSVENQATADERIPELANIPAAVHFLSCEPLLERIELFNVDGEISQRASPHLYSAELLDWIIIGGESGHGARPFDLGWAYDLVAQCQSVGIPVFVKQLGSNPIGHSGQNYPITDSKGGDMGEWPSELRIREFPKELV